MPNCVTKIVRFFSPDTLKKKKFIFLRDYEPGDTHRTIWQKSPDVKLWYVIYRIVHAALMLLLMLISFFHLFLECPLTKTSKERYHCLGKLAHVNPSWPFYLTRWGLMLNFAQALMGLILVVQAYRRQSKATLTDLDTASSTVSTNHPIRPLTEHRFTTFSGTYWGLHSVAVAFSILIDIVYWSILNDYSRKVTIMYLYYASEHGLNFFLMIIDGFIVAFPIMFLHILYHLIFGSAYVIVSLIYYKAGGLDMKFRNRYLYRFMDWRKPRDTCLCVVAIVTCSIMTMFLIMLLDFFKHKFYRPRRSTPTQNSLVVIVPSKSRIDGNQDESRSAGKLIV